MSKLIAGRFDTQAAADAATAALAGAGFQPNVEEAEGDWREGTWADFDPLGTANPAHKLDEPA